MELRPPQHADRLGDTPALAYLVSRFPTVTETFIVREMAELERQGVRVALYAIRRDRPAIVHEEAKRFLDRLGVAPIWSPRVWLHNAQTLLSRPRRYVTLLAATMRGTWRSPPVLMRSLYVFPQAVSLARTMTDRGVRHLHAHRATHPAYMAYIIHQLSPITYSFTAHAHDIYLENPMLGVKIRGAKFVASVSDFNVEYLARMEGEAVRSKLHVVRCGVPAAYVGRPPAGPDRSRRPTVLTVASLRDYKGHEHAIEACRLLHERIGDVVWVALGDGPERGRLQQLAQRAGVANRFLFLGPRSESDVRQAMLEADVFVLPSVALENGRKEGLPVALVEALAAGLPTVATNISGIAELVEDGVTGRLVPERDPTALAEAVAYLLQEPEVARSLAERGQHRIEQEFTLERNVARLRKLLQLELTDSAGRGGRP